MKQRVLFVILAGIFGSFLLHDVRAQSNLQDSLQLLRTLDSLKLVNEVLKNELEELKNVPAEPLQRAVRVRWTGQGMSTSGNINRSLIETSLSVSYSKPGGIFSLDINPRYAFGNQSGLVAERDFWADVNVGVLSQNRLYGILFGQLEVSNLRQINLRLTGGAGLGLRILRSANYTFSMSSALIYESTNFSNPENPDISVIRSSTRIKGEYHFINSKVALRHVVFIQPAINADNLRWNGIVTLEIPVSARLAIQSSVDNSFESVVAEGAKNNDTRWTLGFTWINTRR